MKYIPTFVSIVALVWASAMTLRSERLPAVRDLVATGFLVSPPA